VKIKAILDSHWQRNLEPLYEVQRNLMLLEGTSV